MSDVTLEVRLPEDLVAALGSPERAARRATDALVFELLRDGAIGRSRAAELLGLSRWDVLDLMSRYGIDQGPIDMSELLADSENARRAAGP